MSLGDLNNNRERLRSELRSLKYSEPIDLKALAEGEPSTTLPIIHFCLLSYSNVFAEYIVDQGFDLMSKNDFSFIESVFKLLRQKFNYRPVLKIGQLIASGFAERKIMMLLDLIQLVKTKVNELERFQQAEERKGRTPTKGFEEHQIKLQTPPKAQSRNKEASNELSRAFVKDFKDKQEKAEGLDEVRRLIREVREENNILTDKVKNQEETLKEMQMMIDGEMAKQDARLQLLTSKVRLLETDKKEAPKPEKKKQEGLLSNLGISSNHLAYRAYVQNSPSIDD